MVHVLGYEVAHLSGAMRLIGLEIRWFFWLETSWLIGLKIRWLIGLDIKRLIGRVVNVLFRSCRSLKNSDCERFALVPLYKRATVSKSISPQRATVSKSLSLAFTNKQKCERISLDFFK